MSPTAIAEDGDFLLEIIEWDHDEPWIDKEPVIRGTEIFKVSRNILMVSSQVFTSMLGGGWKEAHRSTVIVQDGKVKTEKYFEGLCLDCMDASKADDEDRDYWSHGTPKEHEFVYGCRAKRHSQPTWYFSYMGRKQRRDKLYRGEKMARYGSDSE